MPHTRRTSSDRLGGGVVRDIEVRPLMRRRERFPRWGGRGPVGPLAMLAVVPAGGLPPHSASIAKADPTPVSITPAIRGTAGANGWYRSNVTFNWQFAPLPDLSRG